MKSTSRGIVPYWAGGIEKWKKFASVVASFYFLATVV